MNNIDLNQLNDLSQKIEESIKQELQKALTEGKSNTSLEKSLAGLPQQLAQSLSPIFNLIGTIAGPRIVTSAQKQRVIDQINVGKAQNTEKGE